jgi:hypothetical protein
MDLSWVPDRYRQTTINEIYHRRHLLSTFPKEELVHMYIDSTIHRVGRVISFFFSRRNWDSPTPTAAGECSPLPLVGGGHTRLRERGWGSPISDEGTYTVVLCIYKYFVAPFMSGLTSLMRLIFK